jgi:hypothetical protein
MAIHGWINGNGKSDMVLTIVRPSFVVGPSFNNPLARHLKWRFVILPSKNEPL